MDAGEKRAKPIKLLRVTQKAWDAAQNRKKTGKLPNKRKGKKKVNHFDRVRANGDGKRW